jgi:hypothetical protein
MSSLGLTQTKNVAAAGRPVEIITRNFGEKRLTSADFLCVGKAFYTVWIDDPLYKLTLLKFLFYIVH